MTNDPKTPHAWRRFILPLAAAMVPAGIGLTCLLTTQLRSYSEVKVEFLSNNRVNIQVAVQVAAAVLGGLQFYAVSSVLRFRTNARAFASDEGPLGQAQIPGVVNISDYNDASRSGWGTRCGPLDKCSGEFVPYFSNFGSFNQLPWKYSAGALQNVIATASTKTADDQTSRYPRLDRILVQHPIVRRRNVGGPEPDTVDGALGRHPELQVRGERLLDQRGVQAQRDQPGVVAHRELRGWLLHLHQLAGPDAPRLGLGRPAQRQLERKPGLEREREPEHDMFFYQHENERLAETNGKIDVTEMHVMRGNQDGLEVLLDQIIGILANGHTIVSWRHVRKTDATLNVAVIKYGEVGYIYTSAAFSLLVLLAVVGEMARIAHGVRPSWERRDAGALMVTIEAEAGVLKLTDRLAHKERKRVSQYSQLGRFTSGMVYQSPVENQSERPDFGYQSPADNQTEKTPFTKTETV
ncbi:hypothetical protein RB594_009909 [Gaeumannomyces avenae]